MDKESITTSVRYNEMIDQHYNGGYYSDKVIAQGRKFESLSEEDKLAFFRDAYNAAYDAAQKIEAHPRTDGIEVDLSAEGLGTIEVVANEYPAETEEDRSHKGLFVKVNAFSPENSVVSDEEHDSAPRDWGDQIYADLDGSFHDSDGYWDIDVEIMRLLDAKETLDLVCQALDIE